MLNLKSMQAKVDKMLSVFTKLEAELNEQKDVLGQAMADNNKQMQELKAENEICYQKITEYSTLVSNPEEHLHYLLLYGDSITASALQRLPEF